MRRHSHALIVAFQVNLLFIAAQPCFAQAVSYTAAQVDYFEKNIRPAFVKYCYDCHSVESGTTRGGLLVDTRAGLVNGGDSGPAIAPGSLEESLLWDAINWESYEMPPSQKMPDSVIEKFKTWIEMGAPDPRIRERSVFNTKITADVIEEGKKHWAFQPPQTPKHDDLDQYIEDELSSQGLKANAQASSLTILRRLHFDLTGLPPSTDAVIAFEAASKKNQKQAIEDEIDELLASPQFGERWGRHWLDVARYADTSGTINVAFPHAWRYRNYVIDSFNDDKPYDQFIREQIAGDLLPAGTDEEWQENLIATGFLAIGMKRLDDRNPRTFQMDMIDEQIDTVTQSILGLTVACARCHDHKSDPIPATDYYAMAGIFLSTNTLYGTVWGQQNHRPSDLILLPILDKNNDRNEYTIPEIKRRIADLQAEMRRMNAEARASGERQQNQFVSMRNRIASLEGILATLNPDGTKKTFGMGVQESSRMVNASVLVGGDVEQPAQEVPRGFLQILNDIDSHPVKKNSSGRRELAEWLTSRSNPLTARVMVNRVWSQLLGAPIVATPNNWGPNGMSPTHPELLDALAVRFMDNGWSVKSLIREIVQSDAYQRSSEFNSQNYEVDPDNTWLWRASPRLLDAEAMRDAMLFASGNLNLSQPRSIVEDWGDGRVDRGPGSQERVNAQTNHRTVYLPVIRNTVHESLDLFGFPDPNGTSAGRQESIVPPQALYAMNGDFTVQQAADMAERMLTISSNRSDQIKWAFLTAYGRPVTSIELQSSLRFLRSVNPAFVNSLSVETQTRSNNSQGRDSGRMQNGRPRQQSGRIQDRQADNRGRRAQSSRNRLGSSQEPTAEQRVLTLFCQSLLASAEFRILD